MRNRHAWISIMMATLIALVVVSCGGGGGEGGGEQHFLPASITRASVATGGAEANNDNSFAYSPSLSSDGRYIAFYSLATNLTSTDTNFVDDIFVRDLLSGTTTHVNVGAGGAQADGTSYNPSVSGNGRYVAFESSATNLVSSDTNARSDIFVYDRETGTTTRASVASDGAQSNGHSYNPCMSSDGRYVVFKSAATNLVAGDTNGYADIFVRDRDTDNDGIFDEAGAVSTTRVSVATGGTQSNGLSDNPVISGNGKYVAFTSNATNLVAGDTNSSYDIFVRDLESGTTVRVSMATDGTEAVTSSGSFSPAISSDGRYVAFESYANNLVTGDTNGYVDIFVRDRDTDNNGIFDETGAVSTTRVSVSSAGAQSNQSNYNPSISSDGSYIAFESNADNLVTGDTNLATDIFVRDLQAGTTARVSTSSGGAEGNDDSMYAAISGDGKYIVFVSDATNLVARDTNASRDVFVTPR